MSNDRLTEQQLQAMADRCEKATAGPWRESEDGGKPSVDCPGQDPPLLTLYFDDDWDDADFIAHARTDLPACLREIGRLKGEYSDLQYQVQCCRVPLGSESAEELHKDILRLLLERATLTQKLAELERERVRQFVRGFVCACSTILREHGAHVEVRDAMKGVGKVDWQMIDEFDREPMREYGFAPSSTPTERPENE